LRKRKQGSLPLMKARIQISPRPENPRTAEIRCAVRFPLTLPIRVITENGEYEATTENISASGVLFRSSQDLGVNRKVEFLLTMPAEVIGTESDVTLHCFGRVVRSYEGTEQFHAAAIIDDYLFSDRV
jgi:PilZ domain